MLEAKLLLLVRFWTHFRDANNVLTTLTVFYDALYKELLPFHVRVVSFQASHSPIAFAVEAMLLIFVLNSLDLYALEWSERT